MAFGSLASALFVAPDSPAILFAGGLSPERRDAAPSEQSFGPLVFPPPILAFEPKRHRRPGLNTLPLTLPDFDFSSMRNIGFMRGSRAGSNETRLLGDGLRRISVRRKGCGELRVQYTNAEGRSRTVDVTPAMRAELAQAFRLAAIRERTEALVRLRTAPAGLSSMYIEADFIDGLAWAARVAGNST